MRRMVWIVGLALAGQLFGCVVVPRYARETLGDPAMAANEDMLGRSYRKLRTTREGAAGGDGTTAGGGCGCGQ